MRLTEGPTQQGFSKTQPFYFILFFNGKFTEELIPCIAMELYVCVYINFFLYLCSRWNCYSLSGSFIFANLGLANMVPL